MKFRRNVLYLNKLTESQKREIAEKYGEIQILDTDTPKASPSCSILSVEPVYEELVFTTQQTTKRFYWTDYNAFSEPKEQLVLATLTVKKTDHPIWPIELHFGCGHVFKTNQKQAEQFLTGQIGFSFSGLDNCAFSVLERIRVSNDDDCLVLNVDKIAYNLEQQLAQTTLPKDKVQLVLEFIS